VVYTIREWSEHDDISELTRLINRAYQTQLDRGFRFTAVDQGPERTAYRIAGGTCLVAEIAGEVVGTVTVKRLDFEGEPDWYRRPGTWHLGQLAVSPDARSTGLGRALLDAAEEVAFRLGATELALDTAEGAGDLRELYARRGYRIVGNVDYRPATNYPSVILSKRIRPVLRTPRTLLRPITHDEVESIEPYWRSAGFDAVYPPGTNTEKLHREVLRRMADAAQEWPQNRYRWGIEIDGKVIGTIRLDRHHELASRRATIGYGFAESYWGKGIATEIVGEVLRFGFEELWLHRVSALVFAVNRRSARVLEKCGFEGEGIDRQAVPWGSEWMDDLRFGLLRDEWMARKSRST